MKRKITWQEFWRVSNARHAWSEPEQFGNIVMRPNRPARRRRAKQGWWLYKRLRQNGELDNHQALKNLDDVLTG